MDKTRINLFIELLELARTQTLQVAESVPVERRFKQLQEGKPTPIWLLGHLANTVNAVVIGYTLQQDSVLSKDQAMRFAPDFAGGTPPTSNPDDYPEWDVVVGLYGMVFDKALAGLRELDDSVLNDPLPAEMNERLRNFFTSIGVTLAFMVNHDAYHRGQMGMLAKL